MKNKKGNTEIVILSITMLLMCLLLTAMLLLYIQINSYIYNVKSDLFYIAQNAYLSVNSGELAYSNYEIDEYNLKEKITELLKLNHPNYNIHINEIRYIYNNNSILIDINLVIKPIVLKDLIGNIELNIKENIKLKLMEVK